MKNAVRPHDSHHNEKDQPFFQSSAEWCGGYDNVALFTTIENQAMADFRLRCHGRAAPAQGHRLQPLL
jgi:hypothetical protein